jgi:lipooligosaccharide transport system ATP-binding protein
MRSEGEGEYLKRQPVIEARNLTKYYDGIKAVDGIDLTIYPGELVGILGPNGAGKSTTIRMLYGFFPPTRGELKVLGYEISQDFRAAKEKIGVVPEENNLDIELTLLENLEVYASYYDINRQEAQARAWELLNFLQLEKKAHVEIDALSHGMKRRALLARALLNQPQLLILDEPTIGLDPQVRHLIWQKLAELKSQGITQVLTTHYMEEASRLCEKVFIMDSGKIIASGSPQELIDQNTEPEVLEIRLRGGWEDFLAAFNLKESAQWIEDRYLIFTQDARSLLEKIKSQDAVIELALLRPANLEDVFLKLTGRKLRE